MNLALMPRADGFKAPRGEVTTRSLFPGEGERRRAAFWKYPWAGTVSAKAATHNLIIRMVAMSRVAVLRTREGS